MDPVKMAYIEGLMLDISKLEAEKQHFINDLNKWRKSASKKEIIKIEKNLSNRINLIDEGLENKRAELREL